MNEIPAEAPALPLPPPGGQQEAAVGPSYHPLPQTDAGQNQGQRHQLAASMEGVERAAPHLQHQNLECIRQNHGPMGAVATTPGYQPNQGQAQSEPTPVRGPEEMMWQQWSAAQSLPIQHLAVHQATGEPASAASLLLHAQNQEKLLTQEGV